MSRVALNLDQIARHIGARIQGTVELTEISGLASIGTAQPGQLTHLSSAAYRNQLPTTQASAVILAEADAAECPCVALVSENPYLAFARATELFSQQPALEIGVHPQASIGADCDIDASAAIGANVVIGAGTVVGPNVRIFANTVVGERCHLAEAVTLHANCTLYSAVKVGARSTIHSHTAIGSDGFGYTPDEQGHWQAISQLGGVTIGADVSVGSSTTIDCGALEDTVIGDGVKIDNQVQIGHNCQIGEHTLICGNVGLAGSTIVGKHCVFAGASGAGGDKPVEICDGVIVSQSTVITQSVQKPGYYSGTILFSEHGKWRRNALRFPSLDDLFKRVKKIEQRLDD